MAQPFHRSVQELVEEDLACDEMVLHPWLPVNGLAMLAGATGVGKTMVALGIALAIASGSSVFGWTAPTSRGVLYVDGEMALSDMQQRAKAMIKGMGLRAETLPLFFICDADQENGLGSLVTSSSLRRGVERIMEEEGLQVLILDNLSALCNSAEENDAESWTVMQDWLLQLRRKGYTVVFLHHTGKPNENGYVKQRGTSKREDVLNSSILLVAKQGGFQIIFTKHRGFVPSTDALYGKIVWAEGADTCRLTHEIKTTTPKVQKLSVAEGEKIMGGLG